MGRCYVAQQQGDIAEFFDAVNAFGPDGLEIFPICNLRFGDICSVISRMFICSVLFNRLFPALVSVVFQLRR